MAWKGIGKALMVSAADSADHTALKLSGGVCMKKMIRPFVFMKVWEHGT